MPDPFGGFESTRELLATTISCAVPLLIAEYRTRGGPDASDVARCREYAMLIGESGDALMFRVKGKTAEVFNALADGIAVMAFCPGGVTAFGTHYEAKPDRPRGQE